jgi:hypothetical protein
MAAIHPLFASMTFEPEVLQAMGKAFDLARLQDTGQSELVKEVLAKRIIDLAHRGVIDPVMLYKHALRGVEKEEPGLRLDTPEGVLALE